MTTDPRRHGLSVRARISATVALLVTGALAAAGIIVYFVESEAVLGSVQREVEQELKEFAALADGTDPDTGRAFEDPTALLSLFLERNVPDDDEELVAWVGGEPVRYYRALDLYQDPEFIDLANRLTRTGGTEYIDSDEGRMRVTAQPVRFGDTHASLLILANLDEDMGELQNTMRTYALVAALSVVLVAGMAHFTAGRLLRPLRDLRATADEIGEGDLSRRIPERGNDDISALTHTVNSMLERLEVAFAGQRRFLDDAGHELRTPLTVIGGHLELLDVDDPAEVAETRDLVLDEVDRMSRLVGDLIMLAKSDRPDFVRPTSVDVGVLTVDVLAKARAMAPREWRLEGTADAVVVADEQRLTQALLQLCDNAIKHTGESDTVSIGSAVVDGAAQLWVADSGPGIPEDRRESVFERFGRARVAANDEGFGLGLSIVRAIAEAHHGTARIEGVDPHGTRVVLRLPRIRPSAPPTTDHPDTHEEK